MDSGTAPANATLCRPTTSAKVEEATDHSREVAEAALAHKLHNPV